MNVKAAMLFSTSQLLSALLLGMCMLLSLSTTAPAMEKREWVCKSKGVYVACTSARSWTPCQEFLVEGIGVAEDKLRAGLEAEEACFDDMKRMLIIQKKTGNASIKSRCGMTTCELQ